MSSKLYTYLHGGAQNISAPGELLPILGHSHSPATGKLWVIKSLNVTTTVVTSVDWQCGIQGPTTGTSFEVNWRGHWTALDGPKEKSWYWSGTFVIKPTFGLFAQTTAGSATFRVSGQVLQIPPTLTPLP